MPDREAFIKYAKLGKCEVCEAEGPVIIVPSQLGSCCCVYCEKCYEYNLEPYFMIITAIRECGWNNMTEKYKNIIEKSLTKMGKTLEEAFDDADYIESEFWENINSALEAEEAEN